MKNITEMFDEVLGNSQSILTLGHLRRALTSPFFGESTIHCVWMRGKHVSTSMSVTRNSDGTTTAYEDNSNNSRGAQQLINRLKSDGISLNNIQSSGTYSHIRTENYHIFTIPRKSDDDKTLQIVGYICEIILSRSINIRNVNFNRAKNRLSKLTHELNSFDNKNSNSGDRKNLDLNRELIFTHFVRDNEDISSFIYNINGTCEIESAAIINADIDMTTLLSIIGRHSHDINICVDQLNVVSFSTETSLGILYFAIFPLRSFHQTESLLKKVLCVFSRTTLTSNKLEAISEYCTTYYNYYLSSTRIRILSAIRQQTKQTTGADIIGHRSIYRSMKAFFLEHLWSILSVSNAYSVTIRVSSVSDSFLDNSGEPHKIGKKKSGSFARGLRLLCGISSKGNSESRSGDYPADIIESAAVIPLSAYSRSVIAFTFLQNEKSFPYVYIDNVPNIPRIYRDAGLLAVLKHRQYSKSELCFCLRIGGVAFGTLNFESPLRNGFIDEIVFLSAVKDAFEDYINNIFYYNDVKWMTNKISAYENVHELKQNRSMFTEEQRVVLDRLIFHGHEVNYFLSVRICDISRHILSWIDERYARLMPHIRDEYKSVLKFSTTSTLYANAVIDPMSFNSIFIILKNLVENVVNNGNFRCDSILVSCDSVFSVHGDGILLIRYRINGAISEDIIDKLCVYPIIRESETDGIVQHYGMFICGLIARSLGGVVSVTGNIREDVKIEIKIPISRICAIESSVVCGVDGND